MDPQWQVTLRDQSSIDARVATADWVMLQRLIQKEPDLAQALYQVVVAGSRNAGLAARFEGGFFRGGRLRPSCRQLIENALKVEDGGQVSLVDPFEQTESNRSILGTVAQNRSIMLENLSRELRNEGDDDYCRSRS